MIYGFWVLALSVMSLHTREPCVACYLSCGWALWPLVERSSKNALRSADRLPYFQPDRKGRLLGELQRPNATHMSYTSGWITFMSVIPESWCLFDQRSDTWHCSATYKVLTYISNDWLNDSEPSTSWPNSFMLESSIILLIIAIITYNRRCIPAR